RIDDGQIRQNGNTHEVVSAYESAMSRGEQRLSQQSRSGGTKARFVNWEIVDPSENARTLTQLRPLTVSFTLDVVQPIKAGRHGIALYNTEQQLILASGPKPVEFEPDKYQLRHTFPMLALRPGSYNWLVTFYDDSDLVDSWNCIPDLVV